MKRKRWRFFMMLILCLTLGGCVKNSTDSEVIEESVDNEQEIGEQICPVFPEAKSLAYIDEQFLLDSMSPAVVRVESGDLFGSGVIWQVDEDYIWIITNQHVIAEMDDTDLLEVVFWDGIRAFGEVSGASEDYDLGFIKVSLQDMGYFTVEKYYQVRYSVDIFDKLSPGDDIFILGSADYPAGNLYYGTIGNKSIYMDTFETEMIWAYCEVKAGMSGSGVFDRYGNLIGIVCAGNDQKEAAVLPITQILAEWQKG